MKLFFWKTISFVLVLACGYLGWRMVTVDKEKRDLAETVALLEGEKKELAGQLVTASAPKPEEQAGLRKTIEERTSKLRELTFKEPVKYRMLERAKLREVLVEKIHEQYAPEEVRQYGRALATLGVVPAGTDLVKLWVSLYDEQVGAFYVPEQRELYTFKDLSLSGGLDQMVLAHELTHALQDQNFDLTKLPLKVKDNDDLALAAAALIEGDATVLMTQYYGESFDARSALRDLGAMLRQRTEKLREAPPFMRALLVFPYQEGQQFAMALFMRGGMQEINRAFAKPPTSTEQVLHPERFLGARDEPTPINVTVLASNEWRLIQSNVLGEFGMREMFHTELGFTEAKIAAEGWDGDRYQVYERAADQPTGLMWRSAWDSEQEAREFAEAYERFAQKRGVTAHVARRGIYVAVVQSAEPSFFPLAEGALEK